MYLKKVRNSWEPKSLTSVSLGMVTKPFLRLWDSREPHSEPLSKNGEKLYIMLCSLPGVVSKKWLIQEITKDPRTTSKDCTSNLCQVWPVFIIQQWDISHCPMDVTFAETIVSAKVTSIGQLQLSNHLKTGFCIYMGFLCLILKFASDSETCN